MAPDREPTDVDQDLERLVEAFRVNDRAGFYDLLTNGPILRAVTKRDDLWNRVGDFGDLKSTVYLHFLQHWDHIRTLALDRGGAVAGYLVETIRNTIRDSLRKTERRKKRERDLFLGFDGRGNEAESVRDRGASVLDELIAEEQRDKLLAVSSDPESAKFGAVFKLKMMMRCPIEDLVRFELTADESLWKPEGTDYPHPREARRVAGWLFRLRKFDVANKRFKPTSRKLVRMLGMVRAKAGEQVLKDKANTFDQWFRRAKVKFVMRLSVDDN